MFSVNADSGLFEKSLEQGSLDITITSVLFTGLQESDCVNAKHIIFQEPFTSTVPGPSHDIYFRPKGHPGLIKMQHDNYIDAILYSTNIEGRRLPPIDGDMPENEAEGKSLDVAIIQHQPEPNDSNKVFADAKPMASKISVSRVNKDVAFVSKVKKSKPSISKQIEIALKEASDFSYLINKMALSKMKGEIEIFHVFHSLSYFHIKDILKIFIKHISICIMVTENSNVRELELLKENSSFMPKSLLIQSTSGQSYDYEENTTLDRFSPFLISERESYAFRMNYNFPENVDYQIGADIINKVCSLSPLKILPFSWFLFGLKIHMFMRSQSINAISIDEHCMVIAKKLNMDRPTVQVALERLTANNIVLYFGDILEDTVFVSIDKFAAVILEIHRNFCNKMPPAVVLSQSELNLTLEDYAEAQVSVNDFVKLFRELMILAPYKDSYIVPSFLPMLKEAERKEACNCDFPVKSLLIECPTTSYEYISMLTVFLLTQTGGKWDILQDESGNPMCLNKNCIKFTLNGGNSIVIISFVANCIEIYLNSPNECLQVLSRILQGLEKSKLVLNSSVDFCKQLSFTCSCNVVNESHTAVYNYEFDKLKCKLSEFTSTPNVHERHWLQSGKQLSNMGL